MDTFFCGDCGKSYKDKALLIKHKKQIHEECEVKWVRNAMVIRLTNLAQLRGTNRIV